jgi:hypothetical protein
LRNFVVGSSKAIIGYFATTAMPYRAECDGSLHAQINAPQRSSETAMADAAEGVPSMADTPAMDNAKSAEVQEGEKDMFWGAGDGKNNSADGEAPAEQTKQQCSDWANADEQDDAKQNMWGASDAQGDEHEEGDMLNVCATWMALYWLRLNLRSVRIHALIYYTLYMSGFFKQ